MIVGCSFGMFENGVNGQLYKKYPDVLFEQATGTQIKKNQAEYFGAGEDTIYLSGMAAGAASKKGVDRLRRPVRHSRGRASHERIYARCAGHASRCEGQADLDERVVLAAQGSRGREEPHRGGCRRHRPERRQPAGRGGRRVEGRSVGRLRLERAQVGAEAVADGGDIQLGPVLREAREEPRSTERGSRASTTAPSRTASRASPPTVRRCRRRPRPRSQPSARRWSRASSTSSRDRSSTRRARSSYPPGRPRRSFRISTRCSGSSRAWSARSRRSCRPASRWGTPPPLLLQMREAPVRPAPLSLPPSA